MKNRTYINDEQQLTFVLQSCPALNSEHGTFNCQGSLARQRRLRRAALWFKHMRCLVDQAPDPAPNPCEESVLEMPSRSTAR